MQQCLQHRLADVLQVGIMPVLLGDGRRLFDHLGVEPMELEKISVIESGARTDVLFRLPR